MRGDTAPADGGCGAVAPPSYGIDEKDHVDRQQTPTLIRMRCHGVPNDVQAVWKLTFF
jgi:hypothetical protein